MAQFPGILTTSALSDDDVWPREPAQGTPSSCVQCFVTVHAERRCLTRTHPSTPYKPLRSRLFGLRTEDQETRLQKSGSWLLLGLESGFLRARAARPFLTVPAAPPGPGAGGAEVGALTGAHAASAGRPRDAGRGDGDPARGSVPFPS